MYEKHVDVPPVAYTPAVCTSDPTPRARVAESGLGYGWGWFVTTILNKRLVLHPGNTDGYSAFVSFMPHDALAVIVLTNQHNTPFPNKVALRIYQYLLTHPVADKLRLPEMLPHTEFFQLSETAMHRASVPSSRAAYPSYTGMFSDPGYGDISVNLFGDGLHISYYQHSWPLRLSADTFYFCMRAFGTAFPFSRKCQSGSSNDEAYQDRLPQLDQFILNRTGTVFGPPTNTDAERRGSPAISIHVNRANNSSKNSRISSRARC